MSKFTPTSKANPCFSCGDTKGNCRHQDIEEIILCMSANSRRKGEIVEGGYKVIDFTEDGLWAVLKLDNSEEWTEERRREWADEQRRRHEKLQWEEQQKLAKFIPIPDRDEQYRRIVATLGLNQKHKDSELSERRGLNSEEIDFAISQGWIASWKPGLKVDASPSLAGVAGGQLTGVFGLAIAAVNPNGKITGFQIASDNRVKFGNYIWLSSANKGGNGPHLPSGELPVFVWRHPEAGQITETWLVEGGLKSLITALKLWLRHGRKDIQIIGAAGANWLGSINAVVEGLGQTSKVVLCPDAGSLDNSHILSNYKKIIEELTTRTYSVSVAWWNQLEKGKDPDIDELKDYSQMKFINFNEFLSIVKEPQIETPKLQQNTQQNKANPISDWKLEYEVKRNQAAKFKFSRKPDVEITDGYLPTYNLESLPLGIIGLKGDWGIGKSHFTANLCSQWQGHILQSAHLNAILHNTAPKYDLMHHHEAKRLNLSLASVERLAICDVTLAANFIPEHWAKGEPFILIWDEICQGLKSLHTSPNLKGILRLKARSKLEWLIKNATYIIAADRDLDDDTLEYLERVRGDARKSFVIQHTGKKGKNRKPITINCNKHKDEVLSQLIKDIKAGFKCILPCETKADLVGLEKQLIKAGISEELMFFAHGDNSNEPHIKAIIQNIDSEYTNYQVVGYTMTMGTAVSLETAHFDRLYAFFAGNVLEASDQCQMLFRYRIECEKTIIWVSPHRRTLEIDTNKILNNLKISIDETNKLITSIDDVDKMHKEGILPTARGEINECDLPFIHHKLNIKARTNASKANPFQSLYDLLVEAGFTIDLKCSDTEAVVICTNEGEIHSQVKKEVREENDRLIAESELMDDIEFDSAKLNAGSLRKAERDKLQKTQLHKDTGLEITQDIVKLERTKNLRRSSKLLKVLLGDESTAVAYDLVDRERNPDIGDQSFYAAIRWLLYELGVIELIEKLKTGWSYTNESLEIKDFGNKARQRRADIKRLLGFNISMDKNSKGFKMTDSTIAGMVLDKVCVLRNSMQIKGQKNRFYSLNTQHWEMLEMVMAHMDSLLHTPTLQGVIEKAKAESEANKEMPKIQERKIEVIPKDEVGQMAEFNHLTNNAVFTMNDLVKYTGDRFTELKEIPLVVVDASDSYVTCKKPDGYFTTWLPTEELSRCDCLVTAT